MNHDWPYEDSPYLVSYPPHVNEPYQHLEEGNCYGSFSGVSEQTEGLPQEARHLDWYCYLHN